MPKPIADTKSSDAFTFLIGVTVLVFVSLTLLFAIMNTHKSGAHFMLGLIITGFALCLGHLLRAWRNGDLGRGFFLLTATLGRLKIDMCILLLLNITDRHATSVTSTLIDPKFKYFVS
jgi:hypothetical protein